MLWSLLLLCPRIVSYVSDFLTCFLPWALSWVVSFCIAFCLTCFYMIFFNLININTYTLELASFSGKQRYTQVYASGYILHTHTCWNWDRVIETEKAIKIARMTKKYFLGYFQQQTESVSASWCVDQWWKNVFADGKQCSRKAELCHVSLPSLRQ